MPLDTRYRLVGTLKLEIEVLRHWSIDLSCPCCTFLPIEVVHPAVATQNPQKKNKPQIPNPNVGEYVTAVAHVHACEVP